MKRAILRFLARPVHLPVRLPFNTTVYLQVETFLATHRPRTIGGTVEIYDLRNVTITAGVGLVVAELGYYKRSLRRLLSPCRSTTGESS